MSRLTCITASYFALPLGYRVQSWTEAASATADLLRSPEHFGARFCSILSRVAELGFTTIDLWNDHLGAAWVTPHHLREARRVLGDLGLRVHSLVGWFGEDEETLSAYARVAQALDCELLSGNQALLASNRPLFIKVLRENRIRLAFENHPETNAEEILACIGEDCEDVLEVAFDTGWAGSKGFSAAAAIPTLAPRLWHVHLKDVRPPREERTGRQLTDLNHETCALGEGIVNPQAVLQALAKAGYTGAIALEHEPETYDPTDEIRLSLQRTREWGVA